MTSSKLAHAPKPHWKPIREAAMQ